MKNTDRVFVAGHKGLVGSAVIDLLKKKGFKNLITVERKKLDLRNYYEVEKYFKRKKIDYMVMSAARAGGIIANSRNQKDFFLENIEIQNSLLKLALKKKIKRTIYLGTSCIYPKLSKIPIKEDSLLTGKLEKTNQCYAIAKIAGIKLCEALKEDYKLDLICLMPTNVYGHNDNFNKISGHVIPAIISKVEEAIRKKRNVVNLLGTGKPLREFIHAEDLASAIIFSLKIKKGTVRKKFGVKLPVLNVGTNQEFSIKKLSELISKYFNFNGKIIFDKKSPDGTFRKKLDSSIINRLGWYPKISFKYGLKKVIENRKN
ncbi:NAD-dependent epimerase/dehydratase family protein [Candidatus Pelagibacter sp.]|nr:NAD-dependent epimerase/dehydratase family protein [Candidatus Pelagibacter sp.]